MMAWFASARQVRRVRLAEGQLERFDQQSKIDRDAAQRAYASLAQIKVALAARDETEQSTKTTLDKIEAQFALYAPPQALVGRAYVLADELDRFLLSYGSLPLAHNLSPIRRLFAAQMVRHQDDRSLGNYRSKFGSRINTLIVQLRAAGATFHYNNEYYASPMNFMVANHINSIGVEIRQAANRLAMTEVKAV
jgi:hypothetical protein